MRDPYFDNAKALLIALVITGHATEILLLNGHAVKPLYIYIYIFHMPAFVLLSGYFSKHVRNLQKSELKYLGLYLISTLIYWPFIQFNLQTILFMLIVPYYVLWYLFSLVLWYILLQFFRKIKHPIILAMIISIAVGYFPIIDKQMSLSRTFVFFPFFLTGYYLQSKHFEVLNTKKLPALICIAILLFCLTIFNFDYKWLYNCHSYCFLGHKEWYAGFYRIALLTVSSIATACFYAIVPSSRINRVTWVGKHTLIIYLIQGLIFVVLKRLILL